MTAPKLMAGLLRSSSLYMIQVSEGRRKQVRRYRLLVVNAGRISDVTALTLQALNKPPTPGSDCEMWHADNSDRTYDADELRGLLNTLTGRDDVTVTLL